MKLNSAWARKACAHPTGLKDERHSLSEPRYHALGRTDDARLLHITFILRANGTLIRVISARDMRRKVRTIYEQSQKDA